MLVEWEGRLDSDRSSKLYFNNCFVIFHFCVKPLDIIQGTLGRFPVVFLVTKKIIFLAGIYFKLIHKIIELNYSVSPDIALIITDNSLTKP